MLSRLKYNDVSYANRVRVNEYSGCLLWLRDLSCCPYCLLRTPTFKYNITSLFDFTNVVETLKQKVSSYAARLQKYKTRLLRYWQNLLFRQDKKKFYSELLGGKDVDQKPPDLVQLELFWRKFLKIQLRLTYVPLGLMIFPLSWQQSLLQWDSQLLKNHPLMVV